MSDGRIKCFKLKLNTEMYNTSIDVIKLYRVEMQCYLFYFNSDDSADIFPLSLRIMINYVILVKITQEQDRILPLQIHPNCT